MAAKKIHVHPVLVGSLGKDEEDEKFSNFKSAGICLFFLFWRYTVSWMYFWWPVMFNPDSYQHCTIYIHHEIHHQLVASPRYLRALNGPCYKQDFFTGPEPSNIYKRLSGGPIVLSQESGAFHRKVGEKKHVTR